MVRLFGLVLLCVVGGMAAADEEVIFDRVSLRAEASAELENDRMVAVLAVQEEGSDPARLADQINRSMGWALKQVDGFETITAETAGYQTQPVYQKGTLSHWRAAQSVRLESGEFSVLSELVGVLQEKLQIQSMEFSVSEEARRTAESGLIDEALDAFKARADRIRKNLGGGGWRIVQLDINSHRNGPEPVRGAQLMAERGAAPPAVEGGRSRLSVTVSGTVQLLPGGARPR